MPEIFTAPCTANLKRLNRSHFWTVSITYRYKNNAKIKKIRFLQRYFHDAPIRSLLSSLRKVVADVESYDDLNGPYRPCIYED